jgi:hypothetical protein
VGKAIGEILPYALGAAIGVVPIIAIILMLVTPEAKRTERRLQPASYSVSH